MIELGAVVTDGGVRFALWATKAGAVDVVIDGRDRHPMNANGDGVFSVDVPGIGAGTRYQFSVDGGPLRPDPRSRFQPDGVHGPSEVIDPATFPWTDTDWPGLEMAGLVVYELHIGAFTAEGTFRSAIEKLPLLAELGVDAIELMPIGAFPGTRNWGYDGVDLFAPSENYGRPEDLQALVDAAHGLGIGVVLDVVYNHFGPSGNYLRVFSEDYFTDRHHTPWGEAINYDGPGAAQVRALVRDNAVQWIRDFHIDGLRLDATEQIVDDSERLILSEIGEAARAATDRSIVLIAEEARNLVDVVHPVAEGGWGFDTTWADDFHHALRVFLTAIADAYYVDYDGTLAEVAKAINAGFIYQGERSTFLGHNRGTAVGAEPASAFTVCLQNHDQVGNQPFGERISQLIDRERLAVATSLLLTLPNPVVLFMGQEFAASTPFLFFTDHDPELGPLVTEGRRREFAGLQAFGNEDLIASIPDPQAAETFLASKMRWEDWDLHRESVRLHADLLRLRKLDPVLRVCDRARTRADVIGAKVLTLLRWSEAGARVLIANFGAETSVPLGIAARHLREIAVEFNSAESIYGGSARQPHVAAIGDGITVNMPPRTAILLSVPVEAVSGADHT